jgi:hypothetical protein
MVLGGGALRVGIVVISCYVICDRWKRCVVTNSLGKSRSTKTEL